MHNNNYKEKQRCWGEFLALYNPKTAVTNRLLLTGYPVDNINERKVNAFKSLLKKVTLQHSSFSSKTNNTTAWNVSSGQLWFLSNIHYYTRGTLCVTIKWFWTLFLRKYTVLHINNFFFLCVWFIKLCLHMQAKLRKIINFTSAPLINPREQSSPVQVLEGCMF